MDDESASEYAARRYDEVYGARSHDRPAPRALVNKLSAALGSRVLPLSAEAAETLAMMSEDDLAASLAELRERDGD